jgi:PhnB protein
MATVNTYLNFNGNCEEAFNFYKSVFGGEFSSFSRFGEMPESEEFKVPEADKNKVMHVGLPIGNTALMGSDTGEEWAHAFVQGNNFSVSVSADSKQETEKIFNALADGGVITMPLNDTFWGDYFGMITDKFGINWMIGYNEQEHK